MHFTMVNFVCLFYTIVKGFYLSKLPSVTSTIIYVNDLLFDTDTTNSFKIISSKIGKTNFLTWAGLRHFLPLHLKTKKSAPSKISLLVTIDKKEI